MTNRVAKFASAVVASLIAGAPLATSSQSAPVAVQDCLAQPKEQTPGGGHWYYRVDHATKRHCWYLRAEGGKSSQATASSNSPGLSKPSASKAENVMPPSVADARAELVPSRIEPTNQLQGAEQGQAPATFTTPAAVSSSTDTQRSVVASRWPDQSTADPSPKAKAVKNGPSETAISASQNRPAPVLAVEQFAAANLPSGTTGYPLQIILLTILGMLVFVGIAGGTIFKFGSSEITRHIRFREKRTRQVGFARKAQPISGPVDRATEFFSQLSRQDRP